MGCINYTVCAARLIKRIKQKIRATDTREINELVTRRTVGICKSLVELSQFDVNFSRNKKSSFLSQDKFTSQVPFSHIMYAKHNFSVIQYYHQLMNILCVMICVIK